MDFEITPKGNPCLKFQEQPGSRTLTEDAMGNRMGRMIYLGGNNWKNYAPLPGDAHPCGGDFAGMFCSKVTIERIPGRMVRVSADYEGYKAAAGRGGTRLITSEQAIPTHPNYSKRPDTWAQRDEFIFGQGPSPNNFGRITDENGAFKMFGQAGTSTPIDGKPLSFIGRMQGVTSFLSQGAYQLDFRAVHNKNWAKNVFNALGKVYDTVQSDSIHIPSNLGGRNWLLTNCQQTIKKRHFDISITLILSGRGGWHPYIYEKAPGGTLNLDSIAEL
jgi:hypothetical protein